MFVPTFPHSYGLAGSAVLRFTRRSLTAPLLVLIVLFALSAPAHARYDGSERDYNSDDRVTSASSGLGGLPTATGLGYDASGNLTSLNGSMLSYDPLGQMSSDGAVSFTTTSPAGGSAKPPMEPRLITCMMAIC
ncbi:MAG TPA: hypothetical protein VFJ58_13540 [Armatimonadota bacterium]|nr:hypothetical protein [Armatimonadota bacterium]